MKRVFIKMDYQSIVSFAQAHRGEDPMRLLLQRERYPEVEMALAVQQIEALRDAPVKWPAWASREGVVYPPRLNREQSSSEATARYKAKLVDPALGSAADLTGGMGVDTYFIAQRVGEMHYCEKDEELCRLARHNFSVLGRGNIEVHEGDGVRWLESQAAESIGTVYVDPARRDRHGGRVTAFEACSPDILPLLPLLRSKGRRLMVKASPMIDIHTALRQLGGASEVHIVAVGGECKEVIFLSGCGETQMVCANLVVGREEVHRFTLAEEQAASCPIADRLERYLYEPHAALMKGGAYRLTGQWYGLGALDANSHLYTSERLVEDFPGRVFEVRAVTRPSAKAVRPYFPEGCAHVVSRNFPLRADLLQKQLRLKEGGEGFVVATTHRGRPCAIVCSVCLKFNV